jgi:hypothetical protein
MAHAETVNVGKVVVLTLTEDEALQLGETLFFQDSSLPSGEATTVGELCDDYWEFEPADARILLAVKEALAKVGY